MKILSLKRFISLFLILFLSVGLITALAQPPHERGRKGMDKGMKRYEKIKKKKLLEMLDMEEDEEKKFLKVYEEWNKKVVEKRDALDKASIILKNRIEEAAETSILKEKTDIVLKKQRELMEIMFAMHDAVAKVLPDDKYAIYVMFETSFHKQIQRLLFDRARKSKRPSMDD